MLELNDKRPKFSSNDLTGISTGVLVKDTPHLTASISIQMGSEISNEVRS